MITFKKTLSAIGVIIICFSAMFLETLFVSYKIDMDKLDITSFSESQRAFYEAQSAMCSMMNIISLGIIGLFSFVILFFSITRYIEENRGNMGILKAMGYRSQTIAFSMMKFALPALVGCGLGYLGALMFSKPMYRTMNADNIIPDFPFTFNLYVFIGVILAPVLLVLIFCYIVSLVKCKGSPLLMINQIATIKSVRKPKEGQDFVQDLKGAILKNHIPLLIFVAFSVICFSSAIQMSFTMYHEADTSPMFFWMIFLIGMLLGISIIILAFRFIYKSNERYIAILRAYGYNEKECYQSLYGSYHLVTVFSFILGTLYQTVFLSYMFKAFASTYNVNYKFDVSGFIYSIILFLIIYAGTNIYYYKRISILKLDNLNTDIG